jgi:hypothetical protein
LKVREEIFMYSGHNHPIWNAFLQIWFLFQAKKLTWVIVKKIVFLEVVFSFIMYVYISEQEHYFDCCFLLLFAAAIVFTAQMFYCNG